MNQREFRQKIARFIKKDIKNDKQSGLIYSEDLNNKKKLYDRFNESGGYCQGISGLWLLNKKLNDEKSY